MPPLCCVPTSFRGFAGGLGFEQCIAARQKDGHCQQIICSLCAAPCGTSREAFGAAVLKAPLSCHCNRGRSWWGEAGGGGELPWGRGGDYT